MGSKAEQPDKTLVDIYEWQRRTHIHIYIISINADSQNKKHSIRTHDKCGEKGWS